MLDGSYVTSFYIKIFALRAEERLNEGVVFFFVKNITLGEIRTDKRYYSLLASSTREIPALYSSRFQC